MHNLNTVKQLRWSVKQKKLMVKLRSYMFDRVWDMPLDYLRTLNIDICQNVYSIHSKLESSLRPATLLKRDSSTGVFL